MSNTRVTETQNINKTAGMIPPLLFSDIKNLYRQRLERLKSVTKDHPLAEFLKFSRTIVEAQFHILQEMPLKKDLTHLSITEDHLPPLAVNRLSRDHYWQQVLKIIIEQLQAKTTEPVQIVLENLNKLASGELEQLADWLLAGEISRVGCDKAPFLWAALSLYWAQLARQLPEQSLSRIVGKTPCCPLCDSMPIASMVQIGSKSGLRYLHCSLCEVEWHMVRVKCSHCGQGGKLNYWSLDSEQAAVKAETCGDCNSYLKIFYQEKDPHLEIVADDLASLFLDAAMEEKQFYRSGLNPLLFSTEI